MEKELTMRFILFSLLVFSNINAQLITPNVITLNKVGAGIINSQTNDKISSSQLSLTSPNGGEKWQVGSSQLITWISSGVTSVKLEYSTDNGTNWISIISGIAAESQSFSWTIPNTPSINCKLKISNIINSSELDLSDNVFQIINSNTNYSMSFDGSSYINLPKSLMNNPDQFTIEAWVNPNQQSSEYGMIFYHGQGAEIQFLIRDDYCVEFDVKLSDDKFYGVSSTNKLKQNQWTHIAGVYNRSELKLYIFINGLLDVIYPIPNLDFQNPLGNVCRLGCYGGVFVRKYIGLMDEVRLSNTARYTTQFSPSLVLTNDNKTIGLWKFNEGFGNYVGDISGNSNSGLAFGTNWSTSFPNSTSSIQLLLPIGGENWQVSSTQNITWTSSGIANVKLEYTTNNGTSWINVTASTSASTGSYSWTIPNTLSTNCKVRISDASNSSLIDQSVKVFQISSVPTNQCAGTPTVTYSGKTYNTVQIGTQCWLRENLDVGTMIIGSQDQANNNLIEKYCYNDDPVNCSIYGGLYQWAEAVQYKNGATNYTSPSPAFSGNIQGICPTGWHIPNYDELQVLLGGGSIAIKEIGQGTGSGAGTNNSGFSALLSGSREVNTTFTNLGAGTGLWNSYSYTISPQTEDFRYIYGNNSDVAWARNEKTNGFDVRCIKDATNSLGLTSPNGGENWQVGLTQNITWTSINVTNVKLEYTTNNGTSWTNIIASIPASIGSFGWTIPNTPSTNCKIRITDQLNSYVTDISEKVFQISSAPTNQCSGTPTVTYSGKTYNTVQIGTQCWLRENLDVGAMIIGTQNQTNNSVIEKYCYNDDPNNCSIYGGLYQWAEAVQYLNGATNTTSPSPAFSNNVQGICPTGWHVPNYNEYLLLNNSVNNSNMLTAVGQGTGTNLSGFSAIFSGQHVYGNQFSLLSDYLKIWTTTEVANSQNAYFLELSVYSNSPTFNYYNKVSGFSVRCIKDAVQSTLGLISPAGGENWQVGSSQNISWTSSGLTNAKLEYTTDGGTNWITIIASTPSSTGSYSWTIPNTPSTNCKVRISDASNSSITSTSNSTFSIIASDNLVQNSSFETGSAGKPDNWTALNYGDATLGWTNIQTHSGTYSVSISNVKNNSSVLSRWVSDFIDVTPATAYDYSSWIFVTKLPGNGQYFSGGIDLFDAQGNQLWSQGGSYSISLNQWQKNAGKLILDQKATKVRFSMSYYNNGTSFDGIGYYDDFELKKINPVILLNLSNPVSGETVNAKSVYKIQWTSQNIQAVDINYNINANSWLSIAKNIPASQGYYYWTVPDTVTQQGRVQIVDSYNPQFFSMTTNPFSIVRPSVKITSLSDGENFVVDTKKNITWNSIGLTNAKLEYTTNGGTTWLSIIASTPASVGSYIWTIPNTPSTNCKIRISDASNSSITDQNVKVFQISSAPINQCAGTPTVTYSGKTYNTVQIGTQCWLRENLDVGTMIQGTVNQTNNSIIEKYCYNNDVNFCSIYGGLYQWAEAVQYKNSATNTTSPSPAFSGNVQGICPTGWHIPTLTEFQLLGTVVSSNGNSLKEIGQGSGTNLSGFTNLLSGYRDQSSNYGNIESISYTQSASEETTQNSFHVEIARSDANISWSSFSKGYGLAVRCIKDASSSNVITVTKPAGGENWVVGTTQNINWTSSGVTNVKIEYTTDNGTNWATIIASTPAISGSYSWTIPNTPSPNCKVRISDISNLNVYDLSDLTFTISLKISKSLAVISPGPGSYSAGTKFQLKWKSIGIEKIKIEFTTDLGTSWSIIYSGISADQDSLDWIIPNIASSQCKIKISDVNDQDTYDISYTFTVFRNTGNNWVSLNNNLKNLKVIIAKEFNKMIFLGTSDGIYKSTDEGKTWYSINKGINNKYIMGIEFYARGYLYATSSYRGRIYRSSDYGETWQEINPSTKVDIDVIKAMCINSNGNLFIGTTQGVFTSTNNGDSWIEINNGLTEKNVTSIKIASNDVLFVGTAGGGIFKSTNSGQTWQAANIGMGNLDFNIKSMFTGKNSLVLAGTYYSGLLRSTDSGQSWSKVNSMIINEFDLNIDNKIYAASENGLFFSIDDGKTWTEANFGLTELSITSITHRSNGNLLIGIWEGGVFTSNEINSIMPVLTNPNGGENWQVGSSQNISWTSSGVTNVKLEYSTNGGTSWLNIIASTPASNGSYLWTIPNTPSTNCIIRICDVSNISLIDVSDKTFQISSVPTNQCPGTPTVTYSGKTYNTVLIGTQCWLRENLDVGTMIVGTQDQTNNSLIEKYCYNDDQNNCSIYGGLYQWAEAVQYKNGATNTSSPNPAFSSNVQGICPTGWHIPSKLEFDLLSVSVNNSRDALLGVGQLNGTNNSGFNALLAAYRNYDGAFYELDTVTFFWSSTDADNKSTYDRHLSIYYNTVVYSFYPKTSGFTVRCIMDTNQLKLGIVTPNGGENWIVGSTKNITWSSIGVTNVKLDYTTNNGTNWINIIGSTPASTGTYSWTIPNTISTNCKVSVSDINSNTKDDSDAIFTISTATIPAIAITSPVGGENWLVGSTQNITWTSSSVSNVKLEYSTNNGSNWITINSTTTASSGSYSWTIPSTASINCIVRISDASNSNIISQSSNKFAIYSIPTTVNISNVINSVDVTIQSNYRMFGIPGNISSLLTQFMIGTQGTDWQIYSCSGDPKNYSVYNGTSVKPGVGYWLISKNAVNISGTVTSVTMNNDGTFTIPLNSGWNIISNPFEKSVLWSQVVSKNAVSDSLWDFNGNWNISSSLEPYKGYFFWNRLKLVGLKIPYSGTLPKTILRKTSTKDVLKIKLLHNNNEVSEVMIGVDSKSQIGFDERDVYIPVSNFEKERLAINNEELQTSYKYLYADYRSERNNQIYHLNLKVIPNQQYELHVDGLMENENEILLIDKASGNIYSMWGNEFKIKSSREEQDYLLVLGDQKFIQEQRLKYNLPSEFSLQQNYPNPFNPETIICYSIPKSGWVNLKIYDALGRVTSELVNEFEEAGKYELSLDASKLKLSSGIYFYRLEFNESRITKKLLFIK